MREEEGLAITRSVRRPSVRPSIRPSVRPGEREMAINYGDGRHRVSAQKRRVGQDLVLESFEVSSLLVPRHRLPMDEA